MMVMAMYLNQTEAKGSNKRNGLKLSMDMTIGCLYK